MSDARPGPDDVPAAARGRAQALLADRRRERAAVAAAGEDVGPSDALIDAVRRVLDTLGPTGARPP